MAISVRLPWSVNLKKVHCSFGKHHLVSGIAVLFMALSANGGASIAAEMVGGDELTKILQQNNLPAPGYKTNVALADTLATVSTFRNPESNARDCKIDAVMIAKTLMSEHQFGIKKVRVQFHEPIGTSPTFQQVDVTLAEVEGFAHGTVSQKDLLDSLQIDVLAEKKAEPATEDKSNESKTSTAAPATSTKEQEQGKGEAKSASAGKPAVTPPKTFLTRRGGISFEIPAGWTATEKPSGSTIFLLNSSNSQDALIQLNFTPSANTPAQMLEGMRQEFAYEGTGFDKYLPTTHFGKGGYPGSLGIVSYPSDNAEYHRVYDLRLYFGQGYELYGWTPMRSYSKMLGAYTTVMNSLSFPAPATAKPSPKAGNPAANKHAHAK
jgi:hypothetical protein